MAFKNLRHDFECNATIDSETIQLAMPLLPGRFSMMVTRSRVIRLFLLISLIASLTVLSTRLQADTGSCGGVTITLPFNDVMGNPFFCQIASAYFSGLTNGTGDGTTYSPTAPVSREQMAAFTTRTLDQSLKRGNRRAALGEWWTNTSTNQRMSASTNQPNPRFLACDGLTVWVSNTDGNTVSRVDIRTQSLICTLTGIPTPQQMVVVSGLIYVVSFQSPGKIYRAQINFTANFTMNEFAVNLGSNPQGITCDGQNLWTANRGTGPGTGSLSRVNLSQTTVTTFTAGFNQPGGILFDGVNLWVTDTGDNSLKRVDTTSGAVLQTIPLSGVVQHPVCDGTNLWIPCTGPDQVVVVRAMGGLRGTVLAQLTGNGLNGPSQAAFDGERICVANISNQSVSLWKASDLSPIATVNITTTSGFTTRSICSDGTTFFVGVQGGASSQIYRF
jgi:hypothetical protein